MIKVSLNRFPFLSLPCLSLFLSRSHSLRLSLSSISIRCSAVFCLLPGLNSLHLCLHSFLLSWSCQGGLVKVCSHVKVFLCVCVRVCVCVCVWLCVVWVA